MKKLEAPGFVLPGVEDITRRDFLVGGAAALLLAGCGSAGGGSESSGETRTVEGYYGPVELPARPRRVIAGGTFNMDYALVLGLPLAAGAALSGAGERSYPEYQREAYPEELRELEAVQTDPANYEQIATYEPDAILDSYSTFDEERYERLSEIAPTFAFSEYVEEEGLEDPGRNVWRKPLREIGNAFGLEDRAEEYIAGYEERAADLGGRLAERWGDATFAFVEPNTESVYVHGTLQDPTSQVLFGDLGAEPASFLTPNPQQLSLETLPEIDADVILLSLRWQEGSLRRDLKSVATYVESPLWQKLPAVRQDQVYRFDAELHYPSPVVASSFLDFVERDLLT